MTEMLHKSENVAKNVANIDMARQIKQLKELLKKCRYELEGEFGIGATNLVEEIEEVLK